MVGVMVVASPPPTSRRLIDWPSDVVPTPP